MLTIFKKIFIWWNQDTIGTKIKTILYGKFVGKDQFGNKYYESKAGKRWVIYAEEIDASKVMQVELERLAHRYSIEVIGVMQEFLPAILDKIASDLRQEADKKYKCKLLEDSGNECK